MGGARRKARARSQITTLSCTPASRLLGAPSTTGMPFWRSSFDMESLTSVRISSPRFRRTRLAAFLLDKSVGVFMKRLMRHIGRKTSNIIK